MAVHNELGKWGEDTAARYLSDKGYVIIARDWRIGHRDIDIIAMHQGWLVVIEVKTRAHGSIVTPEEAVDYRKIQSVCLAANAYVKANRIDAPIRFDIIAVTGNCYNYEINHIKDAFTPPLRTRR